MNLCKYDLDQLKKDYKEAFKTLRQYLSQIKNHIHIQIHNYTLRRDVTICSTTYNNNAN